MEEEWRKLVTIIQKSNEKTIPSKVHTSKKICEMEEKMSNRKGDKNKL